MRRNQFSSLILTNQMDRKEALELLKKPSYDKNELENDLKYISSKLRITVNELKSFHKLPLSYYWDYKNQSKLFSLGEKILNLIGNARRGGSY